MIYSADMGMKKVAGIRIDPGTGKLEAAFVLDNLTSTLQPVRGPADKRVLLLTNMKLSLAIEPLMLALEKANRATDVARCGNGQDPGGIGFFRALAINSLTPPGFGGRVYSLPRSAGVFTRCKRCPHRLRQSRPPRTERHHERRP